MTATAADMVTATGTADSSCSVPERSYRARKAPIRGFFFWRDTSAPEQLARQDVRRVKDFHLPCGVAAAFHIGPARYTAASTPD